MSTKQGPPPAKNCQGKDTFERMNFLYQAGTLMRSTNPMLSSYYGKLCRAVAKKAVLRMEPAVKRTICRRCHYILLAGTSARIRIADDNPKLCELVCEQCNYIRRFPLSETYAGPWLDQPDAVRERLQLEVIPGAVARKAGMRNKPPQITSANKN